MIRARYSARPAARLVWSAVNTRRDHVHHGWLPFSNGGLPRHGVHGIWLIFSLLLYPLLGWLFGSYTVLRWRRLAFPVLVQRLIITGTVTLIVVAFARWFVSPSVEVWLVKPWVQVVWMAALTAWSLLVRIALRRGLLLPDAPRLFSFYQAMRKQTGSFRPGPGGIAPAFRADFPIFLRASFD